MGWEEGYGASGCGSTIEGVMVEVLTTGRWAARFWRSRASVVGRFRVSMEGAIGLGRTGIVEEEKEVVVMAARGGGLRGGAGCGSDTKKTCRIGFLYIDNHQRYKKYI
jgi:hypothetical protein